MFTSAAATLASVVTMLATTTPASADTWNWGKIYSLASNPSNCVDDFYSVFGGQQYFTINYCQNTNTQQFSYDIVDHKIYDGSDGGYSCMAVAPGSTGSGSMIVAAPCSNNANWETWDIVGQTLQNRQASSYNGRPMCLDDPAGRGPVTFLQLYTCNGGTNQNWYVVGYRSFP